MATKVFLKDSTSEVTVGSETKKVANLIQGSSLVSTDATSTVGGPTSGVQFKKGTVLVTWYSDPLRAVTISGTITFNLWALESAAQANTGLDVLVERCDQNGNVLSTIVRSEQGTELGTSATARNWTASPTSTALNEGDRVKITVFGNDAGGNMGNGRTFTMNYDAATGVNGDSYVQFNETITIGVVGAQNGPGTEAVTVDTTLSVAETGAGTDAASVEELASAIVLDDSFTDTDGTLIQNHTPAVGTWSYHPATAPGGDAEINSNRITADGSAVAILPINDVNTGSSFIIEIPFFLLSAPNGNAGVIFCVNATTDNFYIFRYDTGTNLFQFRKTVNSSATGIAEKSLTLSVNDNPLIVVEKSGTTFNFRIDGILYPEFSNITESTFSSGRVGVRFFGSSSPTQGVAFSSIKVTNTEFKNVGETGVGTDSASVTPLIETGETGVGSENTNFEASTSSSEIGAGTESTDFSASISSSETGIGTDTSSIEANTSSNETGFGTDISSIIANIPADEFAPGLDFADAEGESENPTVGETGAGSESVSTSAEILSGEQGSGTEGISISTSVSSSDQGLGFDEAQMLANVDIIETSPGTENTSFSAQIPINEAVPGSENVQISLSISEGGISNDIANITASISSGESLPGIDSASSTPFISVSEVGVGSETIAIQVTTNSGEVFPGVETIQISTELSVNEFGAGTDAVEIESPGQANASETGAGVDNVFISVSLSSGEIGVGNDSAPISVLITASDSGAGIDSLETSAQVFGLESFPGIDNVSSTTTLSIAEGFPGTDFVENSVSITIGEQGIGSESTTFSGTVIASQLGSGIDSASRIILGTLEISGKLRMTITNSNRTRVSVAKPVSRKAFIADDGQTYSEVTNG